MHTVYAVSYDLRQTGEPDYEGLIAELKNSPGWWHNLESTWLISTLESANDVFKRIAPHIRKIDSVLIIEVRDNKAGWLPKEAWEWINDQVPPSELNPADAQRIIASRTFGR